MGADLGIPPVRAGDPARDVATIDLNYGAGYDLVVRSDCGVVKVYSTRDGCMVAVNSTKARQIGEEFAAAMHAAAEATDRAARGGVR